MSQCCIKVAGIQESVRNIYFYFREKSIHSSKNVLHYCSLSLRTALKQFSVNAKSRAKVSTAEIYSWRKLFIILLLLLLLYLNLKNFNKNSSFFLNFISLQFHLLILPILGIRTNGALPCPICKLNEYPKLRDTWSRAGAWVSIINIINFFEGVTLSLSLSMYKRRFTTTNYVTRLIFRLNSSLSHMARVSEHQARNIKL